MKTIIWVMWPGKNATEQDITNAYEIGKFSTEKNYVTLTGWRNEWFMNEALKWAKENWWLILWILPTDVELLFQNIFLYQLIWELEEII